MPILGIPIGTGNSKPRRGVKSPQMTSPKLASSYNDPLVAKGIAAASLVQAMSGKPKDTRSVGAKSVDDWMKYK